MTKRRRQRLRVAVAALVASGLAIPALVVAVGHSRGHATPAESPAVRSAIKKFAVKPLDLTKVTFAPTGANTPRLFFNGTPVLAGTPAARATNLPGGGAATGTGHVSAAGVGLSSAATSKTTLGSRATTTTTTTTFPPSSGATKVAPSGYPDQLVSLYQQMYTVNEQAAAASPPPSGGAQPEPVSQFAKAVHNTPPEDLNVLYTATTANPQWASVQRLYAKLGSQLSAQRRAGISAQAVPGTVPLHAASLSHTSPYPYPNTGSTTTFAPAVTATTDPNLNEANCPPGAPGGNYGEDSIYAAQVAIDVFTQTDAAVPQQLTVGAEVLGEGTTVTIPDPAWVIVQALLGAAQITHDTLAYEQAKFNACNTVDQQAEVTGIYNNVAYLTALVDSRTTAIENEAEAIFALVDSQTTQILNQLAAVQAAINLQLKIIIEQDLLQGSSGAVAEIQLPASAGGYLDAVPIGVQQIVTNALSQMTQAKQAINPAAPQDLAAANAALAAKQYRQAFGLYAEAYQEVVQ